MGLRIGGVTERVAVLSDGLQEYALFIPEAYTTDRKWPVLFVLDPRGRAVSALELFVDSAARHGYIVLSSYQSRSDAPIAITQQALGAMLEDAQQRFEIDPIRIYLTGMSGTSHAAWRWGTALGANVAGVIGCAGGLPNDWEAEVKGVPFAYFGIAGVADFNYQEMRELHGLLDESGAEHRFETFDGAHGWPPERLTSAALDWMELVALKSGLSAGSRLDVRKLMASDLASAAAASDELTRFHRLRQIIRDYRGLVDVAPHEARLAELEGSAAVRRGLKSEAAFAAREKDYLSSKLGPWLRDIRAEDRLAPTLRRSLVDLRIGALGEQSKDADPEKARSARRLLESLYSSTSFYIPNYFVEREIFDRAALSLRVAVEIAPERRRAHWKLAEVLARGGRVEEAIAALAGAIELGRVDVGRLTSDETWKALRSHPDWPSLVERAARSTVP